MTPRAMVATALLLGAFVTVAGAYGLIYCLHRLRQRSILRFASFASYGALCAITGAILALTPLHAGWKILILFSCAAYSVIPPITWHYLQSLHQERRSPYASRTVKHADRFVPRRFRIT